MLTFLAFPTFLMIGVVYGDIASAQTWTQKVELQPVRERGATEIAAEAQNPTIPDSVFVSGTVPKWIWGPDNDANCVLRKSVELSGFRAARLKASCDNVGSVFINGNRVASSSAWQEPMEADVTKTLVEGKNLIEAEVQDQGGIAAFVLKLAVTLEDGSILEVTTDESWEVTAKRGDAAPGPDGVSVKGDYGDQPWGSVFSNAAGAGRVPAGVFEVLPGFQVEKLFTVPKEELGSWVCITFDNKGRLLASDEGDKGIYRITLPAVAGRIVASVPSPPHKGEKVAGRPDEGGVAQSGEPNAECNESQNANPLTPALSPENGGEGAIAETIVERLDFSQCEFQPTGAQGMLWAFDALYFSINGGPGSGLYRAKDTDDDDQFDECVKLKEFRGGGEHGPHALRLSPDGKRIFVIAGNHTLPPFNPGDELTNKDFASRVPTNWSEDHLLPRMWDAGGHAVGILAPGGWIASTDPDGKTWDMWSIGYRNAYDMAFNADGELFAYDSDMEWDVGMPWYRPTRVVHATAGSEFGWRSGSGVWPDYYLDSLPPMINIGPGSPVGVEFGYGSPVAADSEIARQAHATVPYSADGKSILVPLKFPAEYQKALFICDWTFGTMYAIHTEPQMSTYKATKEEFLSRTPLPLTDVVAGPDGAMYFSVGGRGTQSELFRVTYVGEESISPGQIVNAEGKDDRTARHRLESLPPNSDSQDEINIIRATFDSVDRHQQLAAMRALQRIRNGGGPVGHPMTRLGHIAETTAVITMLDQKTTDVPFLTWHYDRMTAELIRGMFDFVLFDSADVFSRSANWSVEEKLAALRCLALAEQRVGPLSDEVHQALIKAIDPQFPSDNDVLNRELCQMLVYLKSPTVIEKTIKLLEAPSKPTAHTLASGGRQPTGTSPDASFSQDLLARNRGYGGAITASIEKAPDQQQIWYAFCLRNLKEGWTMDQRKAYFAWFERAHSWAGGASFHGFLRNIEKEAFENASEQERLLIEASGARKPYTLPEIPKPAGPGKDWTLEEVRTLAATGLTDRNFENGQKMFAATRCILCHRFAGDGGATGPDLTQLAGRFNLRDLTEATMEPSKVISDQYKASTVVTTDGKSISGRILSQNDDLITILTSPEDPTKITEIPKGDIEEIQPSIVSIMPADLLKPLNQDEVLDLLAYLLSRGDKGNGMFTK